MTIRTFVLPDLGEGLEDAEIIEWHVEVGAAVKLNEPLCTVETAKAEVQIPSPFAGTVVELGAPAGATLDVGSPLVRIDIGPAPGEADSVIDLAAEEPGADQRRSVLVGYGASAPVARRRRARAGQAGQDSGAPGGDGKRGDGNRAGAAVLAKPAVRRLARELGVDLVRLAPGSGPEGSITRSDVLAAGTGSDGGGEGCGAEAGTDFELVAVRGVQARMAEAVTRSHQELPAAGAGRWVDCTALVARRGALRASAQPVHRVPVEATPFALVARAMVLALRDHRELNASFDAERRAVRRYRPVHLGVAVDTPRGLVVPVVRDADRLTLHEFVSELDRLAQGARSGTLAPGELTGSTCSISNFGAFGLDDGWPMLNPPEALIVGVGSIRDRVVAVDGALAVRPTVKLTCAFDHRVADGAQVGRFMSAFAQLIEAADELDRP